MALTQNEQEIMAEIYHEANLKPIMAKPKEFPQLPKKSLVKPRAITLKTTRR